MKKANGTKQQQGDPAGDATGTFDWETLPDLAKDRWIVSPGGIRSGIQPHWSLPYSKGQDGAILSSAQRSVKQVMQLVSETFVSILRSP